MDMARAKEIIEILADGINPITGEVLPPDDCCNQAEVIRAFHTILSSPKKDQRSNLPENAGKPWTSEDEAMLSDLFNSGMKIGEISKELRRSRGAINSRLVYMGLIQKRDESQ